MPPSPRFACSAGVSAAAVVGLEGGRRRNEAEGGAFGGSEAHIVLMAERVDNVRVLG